MKHGNVSSQLTVKNLLPANIPVSAFVTLVINTFQCWRLC